MIQITQLKLPVEHTEKELKERIAAELGIRTKELKGWKIVRRSVDARKKRRAEIRVYHLGGNSRRKQNPRKK